MNYDVELWKKIRKENKLTYSQLALASDMSERAIIGIFNQEEKYKNPTAATVQAIEKALGIDQKQKAQVAFNDPFKGLSPDDRKKAEEFIEFLKQKNK